MERKGGMGGIDLAINRPLLKLYRVLLTTSRIPMLVWHHMTNVDFYFGEYYI